MNLAFIPLSSRNSGIEGLCLNQAGTELFYAFERPTKSCQQQRITSIGRIDLETNKVEYFAYQLHPVREDVLQTNGISEILWLNDSTLLVMERAYIPGKGNVVRLYESDLTPVMDFSNMAIECAGTIHTIRSWLVLDFANVSELNIDNAEGMTFNEDRSSLYIITDNNFSSSQETQLVKLAITWKSQ